MEEKLKQQVLDVEAAKIGQSINKKEERKSNDSTSDSKNKKNEFKRFSTDEESSSKMSKREKAKAIFTELENIPSEEYFQKKVTYRKDKKTGQVTTVLLDYLPWASCFAFLYKTYSDLEWRIVEYNSDGDEIIPNTRKTVHKKNPDGSFYMEVTIQRGLPYRIICGTMEVTSEMTINGITRRMTLPVLDLKNEAIPPNLANTGIINKTQWRCLVKNAAMFGLGIKAFIGEDLPSEEEIDAGIEKKMKLEPISKKKKEQEKEIVKNTGSPQPNAQVQQKEVKKKATPAKKKAEKINDTSDALNYKIDGPYGNNSKAVGTVMANLILKANKKQSSLDALNWYSTNGKNGDEVVAKKLLQMLETGEIKFPTVS